MSNRIRPATVGTFELTVLVAAAAMLAACGSTVTYLEGDGGGDGGGGGGSGAAPPCAPPTIGCDGACVDPSSDPQHCGSCGVSCGPAQVCSNFACGNACAPGLSNCDGACVDTLHDPANCGSCGFSCTPPNSCLDGSCINVPPCPPPLSPCWDLCVDLLDDPFNCGGCGIVCGSDSTCVAGECSSSCGPLTPCGDICVDVLNDPNHCGGCNIQCSDSQTCSSGQCQCSDPLCGVCDVEPLGSLVPLTVSGTAFIDHQAPSCAPAGSPDDAFLFTAPTDGSYRFDTVGSGYDTVLYLTDPQSCGQIACNDDHESLTSELSLDMAAGDQVMVVVDGFGGASGYYELHIDVIPTGQCPLADLGSNVPQTVSGSTVGMGSDYVGLCAGSGPEVSYAFTPPQTGNYLFTTQGSSFDTVLYVHDGGCNGPPLACNDDYNGLQSLLYLALQQGQQIVVFVDSFSQPGSYVLNVYGPM